MLISCPECSREISDRAVTCPGCGCPISAAPARVIAPQKVRKFKRLPPGFGCVRMLHGRRRHPFAAYPPVKEYKLTGSPVQPKAIGYYETYNEAYSALVAWHAEGRPITGLSFAQVYERFMKDKFSDPASQLEFADSTIKNYKWAYGKCADLYDKPMREIFREDMQGIIDGLHLSYSSAGFMRTLFKGMYAYSMENGIVTTDYSDFVKIKQKREYESGVPFTQEEVDELWKHRSSYNVQIALILCYSGLRISELKKCHIDLERQVFEHGVKTAAGKNRIVPIHSAILPFVREFDQAGFSVGNYQDRLFNKMLTSLGFPNAATGEKHTPHDCRHTFSWMADKAKMDDLSKHLIMGHSLGKDVEKNTYGHRTLEELRAEMEKIKRV